MPTRTLLLTVILATVACAGDPDGQPPSADTTGSAITTGDPLPGRAGAATEPPGGDRPATRTDTLMLEGMPEPMALRLFRTPSDFPLPFSAYVPGDMEPEAMASGEESGRAIRFVAEFGGVRNDGAFIHLFVYPEGTDAQRALAMARAYEAASGIPVSQGLEPLGESEAGRRMPWADQAFVIRYQAGGTWYLGSIGVGSREGRLFHVLTHYPAEYADGFAPRSAMILETWMWADGTRLQ